MGKTKLEKLFRHLSSKIDKGNINYVVPDIWNAWNYDGGEMRRLPSNELIVNPYRFYSRLIEKYILPKKKAGKDYARSLSQCENKGGSGGNWISESTLYSAMIRASSAWDHDRSFSLDCANFDQMKETGTFVKMLALLPFLLKMGINAIYLLPLNRFDRKNRKGELGSPYAVASFFDLDPDLADPLEGNKMSVEEQFQAFVEACHILGIRVIIDIIPRTNAIVNDLIQEHPDWFYWIKDTEYKDYKVPFIEGLGNTLPPEAKYMKTVYASKDVMRHIRMFCKDPETTDPLTWQKLVDSHPEDLTQAITEQFGLRIAPAFSDHINDIQPPWTDITFFRLYLDHPVETRKYLVDQDIPPYILFDTIKGNLFPGTIPNMPLWELLASIIPHYQVNYGIDGARIDMGHALPKELIRMIISRARIEDPDFAFIAEELNPGNAEKSRDLGYNIIIGNGFWMEPRIWEKHLHDFVYGANSTALPMFACSETHDTARIAAREGGRTLARMLIVLNMLLPNLVPFINSGQEVYETQPMNTGVDCTEQDRFNLPPGDMFYGKLALFDKYAFHYLDPNRWELADHLDGVKSIRKNWIRELTDRESYIPLHFVQNDNMALGVSYFNKASGKCLVVIANSNPYGDISGKLLLDELRKKTGNQNHAGKLLYSTYELGRDYGDFDLAGNISFHLRSGEIKVIEF